MYYLSLVPWHSGRALDLCDLGPRLDPRRSQHSLFDADDLKGGAGIVLGPAGGISAL